MNAYYIVKHLLTAIYDLFHQLTQLHFINLFKVFYLRRHDPCPATQKQGVPLTRQTRPTYLHTPNWKCTIGAFIKL